MSIKAEPFLSRMINRNLYTPDDVYDINNPKITKTIDSITKLLSNNTQGFENTVLSRMIDGTNTPLVQYGNIALMNALNDRVLSYVRQNELPTVSFEGLNIKVNRPLKDWKITPNDGIENSISSLLNVISGYTTLSNPVPELDSFQGTNTEKQKMLNEWLKENRGIGQKLAYEENISRNEYTDINQFDETTSKIKEKYDNDINNSNLIEKDNGYYPIYDINNPNNIGNRISPLSSAYYHIKKDGTYKLIPKAGGTYTDDTKETFLRGFNVKNQYDSPLKAMKYYQPNRLNSTLKTVFPTIAPYNNEDYKKLMFSITNLSLKEYNNGVINLSEKNENDTMWFVPYGLTFSENVNINWEKVDILGRNEPIYTYGGTERRCNISFILIADYPSELNNLKKWKNISTNEMDKFFRQNNSFNDEVKVSKTDIDNKNNETEEKVIVYDNNNIDNPYSKNNSLKYYFDNNSYELKNPNSFINDDIKNSGKIGTENFINNINDMVDFLNSDEGKKYKIILVGNSSALYKSKYNVNLSYKRSVSVLDMIKTNLVDKGSNELTLYNESLSSTKVIPNSALKNDRIVIKPIGETNSNQDITEINVSMVDRYVNVYLELDTTRFSVNDKTYTNDNEKNIQPQNDVEYFDNDNYRFKTIDEKTNLFTDELEDIELRNSLINAYSNNIEYFLPTYHSQTPIDLNKRVTFLHQCTRQGNNVDSINNDNNTGNSIFGKPPVSILRLGDYIHTKILIENIEFNYEPLIWDTNPEGIGMQPMMCTVTMSCVMLGGSSISEPINKLQNALATNFYANTIYYKK